MHKKRSSHAKNICKSMQYTLTSHCNRGKNTLRLWCWYIECAIVWRLCKRGWSSFGAVVCFTTMV